MMGRPVIPVRVRIPGTSFLREWPVWNCDIRAIHSISMRALRSVIEGFYPCPVSQAELAVLVSVGVLLTVFVPEELERHVLSGEFFVYIIEGRHVAPFHRERTVDGKRRFSRRASSSSSGRGHVSPAFSARSRYSLTVLLPTPQPLAACLTDRPLPQQTCKISLTFLIDNVVFAIGAFRRFWRKAFHGIYILRVTFRVYRVGWPDSS